MPRSRKNASGRASHAALITQNFFSQPPSTHKTGVDALAHSNSTPIDANLRRLESIMNGLTPRDAERFRAYTSKIRRSPTGNRDFDTLVDMLAAISVCKDKLEHQLEPSKKLTTFEMEAFLEHVIEHYEHQLAHYAQKGKEVIETIMKRYTPSLPMSLTTPTIIDLDQSTLASMLKNTVIETDFASTLMKSDLINWNQHARELLLIHDVIRPLALFNVEKRWGFVDEAVRAIDGSGDAESRRSPVVTPSFRQILNSPECLFDLAEASLKRENLSKEKVTVEKLTKKDKSKGKNIEMKPEKETSDEKGKQRDSNDKLEEPPGQSDLLIPHEEFLAKAKAQREEATVALDLALEKYQTNLEEGIKMIQTLDVPIRNDESKPSVLPKSFEYRGVTIASKQGLPRQLRQHLFDLQYTEDRIGHLAPIEERLHERAHQVMRYWSSASKECWAYAEDRIHEMPAMRGSEYCRVEMAASFVLVSNLQRKVIGWLSKEGSHIQTSNLATALNVVDRTFVEVKAELQAKEEAHRKRFASVKMLLSAPDVMSALEATRPR